MMRIHDGRTEFYQYDTNQKLICDSCQVGEEIHFSNNFYSKAAICKTYEFEGSIVVDVPNLYLLTSGELLVYLTHADNSGRSTLKQYTFAVRERKRPSDYVYTETEVLTIETVVDNALRKAKESGDFKGEQGNDYVLQESDKQEIVKAVVDKLPVYDGEVTDGTPGEDGTSLTIVSVLESTEAGGENVIIFSDGSTLAIKNGVQGSRGEKGADGNGIESAVLNDDYTLTLTFTDGTNYTTPSIRGATGATGAGGKDGADGTSVTIVSITESDEDGGENVVTFSDGTKLTVKNGSKGSAGDPNVIPSYTNVLSTALASDGVSVYNADGTPGYKADTRCNSSGVDVSSTDGHYVTGFIPVSESDVNVIRLKNITMIKSDANTCLVFYYKDDITGTYYGCHGGTNLTDYHSAIWSDDGNLEQFTIPSNAGYKYIRIQCTGITEDSVITINEEIPEDETETRLSNLENSLKELGDKVTELETTTPDGIPSYWQTALDEGAEAINTYLCSAGSDKSAFLFYSDAHWNYGSQMSPKLLKYLYEHTGMTKTFFGGDIVNDEATDYDTMEYLWAWRNMLKDLPNHHSVVGNHDDGNATNNLFSEQYVYGYLLAAEETVDVVRGDSGMYYYIDNSPEKTRYIFLDTAYQGVNTAQQDFIKQALLTTKEGWHIVAISHIWYDTDWTDTSNPVVGDINSGASVVLAMFDSYNSRSGEYADCGGWVEFCVGGHTHWDYDGTSTTGIPIVLVETDSKHVRSGLTYAAGTTTESSVNGIIADYSNHKIHVVRIGRGESREVEVTNYVVSYTNVLPLALAADGVSVYNAEDTPGYKANVRWSQSGQAESESTGTYLTGWIPVSAGDVIRLANMKTQSYFIFLHSNEIGSTNGSLDHSGIISYNSAEVDESDNIVKFTIPTSAPYSYFRIMCNGIDATSIITINEEIE